ncbi:uncharacterized protein K452DRAFT_260785 [Aplosporella prunicola CBS 121167]|uniref:Uncharacterized protein n=1 Tax=Aplosporella prunicola CBS 121167 TaxID=1176127 RepID=A0A6A6ATS2_9PEZI|nr:uncharacterized protein K452DRAFT_260785 [Aplosporella prunicola CBS 121167]KAF2135369.1 hypothetical protein K452DRAFT_260785 [Aplosporella prunicola CBS 121167]
MVELSAGGSVALGVFVGLLSTSIQSVGLTLQRKSHLLEDEKEETHTRRPPYRRRRWQLGMFMFIVANLVGSTIQITTLPLPVLSTLQASGLVFNSLCATIVLSEPFTRYSLVGTILVTAGAVLIGTFGALTEPSHTLDQLLVLLGKAAFLVWLFATLLVTALLFVAQWVLKRLSPRPTPVIRLLRGMCFGAMSGILSAHCLLIAKSAVELLVRTIVDRHNQFVRWQSWAILLGLVAFALTQLYYLHRGLKLCSTSILYPFVFCIYNIIAILDGLIYFRQISRLPVRDACLIAVGTVILLAGVAALSWRLDDQDPSTSTTSKHRRKASHRSITGVPPPRTALTPGLGFINTGEEEEDASTGTDTPPFDEEASVGTKRTGNNGILTHRTMEPDEQTPLLLRTNTAPAPKARYKPRGLQNLRRMTISEEAGEIWDELNDRGVLRSPSLKSPMEPRSRERPSAPNRSKTMPLNHSSSTMNHRRRSSWWNSLASGGQRLMPGNISLGLPGRESSPLALSGDGGDEDDDPAVALLSPSPDRNRSWSVRLPRVRARAGGVDQRREGWFRLWRWGGSGGEN